MIPVTSQGQFDKALIEHPALLVLFGGERCGVCQVVKPQLERAIADRFPEVALLYLDCQNEAESICAQQRIFSLPVVQLWFNGQKFDEWVRTFSIGQVLTAIERPYRMIFCNYSAK
ncbi:thioredoxin family protein [Saccharospirillum impatiens]|uniref:thioredoxin family protein n=1 Tax=Saccharospirillum impatiens TaxID=169438 RepID=UPI0004209229|nr:thioredoxin family protein [Saccharospirillum impatiens]